MKISLGNTGVLNKTVPTPVSYEMFGYYSTCRTDPVPSPLAHEHPHNTFLNFPTAASELQSICVFHTARSGIPLRACPQSITVHVHRKNLFS